MALLLVICWLALPAWGLFRFLTRKGRTIADEHENRTNGTRTQVGLFALIMLSVGVGFYFWARHLGLPTPVILGSLLLVEGLGGMIVSLTEWWRLSHIGVSMGLVMGGFLLPFMETTSVAVPVGGAFMLGSLLSAGILSLQMRYHNGPSQTDVADTPNQGCSTVFND